MTADPRQARAATVLLDRFLGGESTIAEARKLAEWLKVWERLVTERLAPIHGETRSAHREPADWALIARMAHARLPRLVNDKGIRLVASGYRECDRVRTDEPAILVFVNRKRARKSFRAQDPRLLPRHVQQHRGRRVRIDVIESGRVIPASACPGARIRGGRTVGTLGALAVDRLSAARLVLTAGHVAALFGGVPIHSVHPSGASGALGSVHRVERIVDAASIVLPPGVACSQSIPFLGPIKGFRSTVLPDANRLVFTMGAVTGAPQAGTVVSPAPFASMIPVVDPIVVQIPVRRGDSGAPLIDDNNHLLGILHGFLEVRPDLAVFSSISSVMEALQCDLV